jgi:bacterioferritin (cytochrome b1)
MRSSDDSATAATDRQGLVDELNRLMAEEAEACLRYFHMRFRLRDEDRAAAEKFLDEAVKETLEHAASIARQIRALGHIPTLRVNLSLGGGPIRLEAALSEALDVEQQALEAYQDCLPRAAGDRALEEFIRNQVAIETEHVGEIRAFVQASGRVKPGDGQ